MNPHKGARMTPITTRYAAARARVPTLHRDALADAARTAPLATSERPTMSATDIVIGGRRLRVLASIDVSERGQELHVSVSRPDSQGQPTRGVWWEDLVSVRACCWPDEADVMQVLPGDQRGERWVNLGEVFHLLGPVVS